MTDTPLTSVIILNFNGREHLPECLASVAALDYPHDRLEVVVADNGSTDGSPAWVREHFPGVRVVELGQNLGFAEGNNRGAAAAQGEIIAFLNTDTRVDPQWLRELVAPLAAADPVLAATAAKMLTWEGTGLDFPVYATLMGMPYASRGDRTYRRPGDYDTPHYLLFPSGGAMAIRRSAFLDVGGFDADYFMYHEDVDLGWRLWLCGYTVLYVPTAVAYHKSGGSSAGDPAPLYFLNERNALYTVVKNAGDAWLARLLPLLLLWLIERTGLYLGAEPSAFALRADPTAQPSSWTVTRGGLSGVAAVRDLIRQLPGLLEKRAAIQARRARSDEEIAALFDLPRDTFIQMMLGVGADFRGAVGLLDLLGLGSGEASLFRRHVGRLTQAFAAGVEEGQSLLDCFFYLADHTPEEAAAAFGPETPLRLSEYSGLSTGDLSLLARLFTLVGSRLLAGLVPGRASSGGTPIKSMVSEDLLPLLREASWRDAVFYREELHKRTDQLIKTLQADRERTAQAMERQAQWAVEREGLQADLAAARFGLAQLEASQAQWSAERERLEADLQRVRQELQTIHESLGYRLLEGYRRRAARLFPSGTRRARFHGRLLRGLRWLLDVRLRSSGPPTGGNRRGVIRLMARAVAVGREEGWGALWARARARLAPPSPAAPVQPAEARLITEIRPLVFPMVSAPRVSIVIPVHGNAVYTYNCLKAVLEHTDGEPYEVIVVDDGSTDHTPDMLRQITGISVVNNARSQGFIEACLLGAERATGEFLLFLNNDTKVRLGWLRALVRTMDADRSIGVVGAKLIYPDGRLQEAGGIIWSDGVGWNYGRMDDPDRPEYNFVREVDYCSGACLMVRRDLWIRAGGFDRRYLPAYYEDADLAFTARALGSRVVYQPNAEVIHFEGVSHGTDLASGVKRYQEVNREMFIQKWREALGREHWPHGTDLLIARQRGRRKRALVVDHYVPRADRDSGSLRMFSVLRLLADLGFAVTFLPGNLARMEPYTGTLQQLGVEVLYGPFSPEEYVATAGPHLDLVWVARPDVAATWLPLLRQHAVRARFIYDTVDLHFLRERRRAALEGSVATQRRAEELRALELSAARRCDATVVVSDVEREVLLQEDPGLRVFVIPNVHEVLGVGPSFSERRDLLFIGNFVHPPNGDSMLYFVREVFPRVKEAIPGIRLFIVGDNPTASVRALASADVIVTGWVKDVTPFFHGCRVFVAPLRYGAGVKGKIGQSLSLGLPVVTTSVGAEGMGLVDGQDALLADSAEEFAARVVELYHDGDLWNRLSKNAVVYVRTHCTPEVIKGKIAAMLSDLTAGDGMVRLPGNVEIRNGYEEFCPMLEEARARNPLQSPNGYYPYGTIHSIPQILPILDRHGLDLKHMLAGKAVLDLGCGDGDLAFFLERFWPARVVAIDAAAFNFNGMEACHVLKKVFNSRVELIDADVHTLDFSTLPVFDVAFCFGFLYHSRHPLWVLESLARATRHLFLTTKVFDHDQAHVYFYDMGECNNDPTNWWCFSPKALGLMLKRAGFTLHLLERLDQNAGRSHPVDLTHDGRAFVYATAGAP